MYEHTLLSPWTSLQTGKDIKSMNGSIFDIMVKRIANEPIQVYKMKAHTYLWNGCRKYMYIKSTYVLVTCLGMYMLCCG